MGAHLENVPPREQKRGGTRGGTGVFQDPAPPTEALAQSEELPDAYSDWRKEIYWRDDKRPYFKHVKGRGKDRKRRYGGKLDKLKPERIERYVRNANEKHRQKLTHRPG